MPPNLFPFLYQTRTLNLACRRPLTTILLTHKTGLATWSKNVDNSIPFEWEDEEQASAHHIADQQSTLTPTETEIFKSIFDDISQGRMPKARQRPQPATGQSGEAASASKHGSSAHAFNHQHSGSSIIEQARGTESSGEFLSRYPASLRRAAETALGKFELAPARPKLRGMTELDAAEAKQMAEWARFEKIRDEEKSRVEALMKACETDYELWDVMEEEVFSLPERLEILQEPEGMPNAKRKRRGKKKAAPVKATGDDKPIMDVHGPLYSHYLSTGIGLFDAAFQKPSSFAFRILPRIKELGLSSYVLGVSTPLFSKLAHIHWNRFGDAVSAFDALDEMKSVGLDVNNEVEDLVEQIRDHLHGCTWGAQGPFVMAMMESPPYDAGLNTRVELAQEHIRKCHEARQEEKYHQQRQHEQ